MFDLDSVTDDALCELMLERNEQTISVQKPNIAKKKLKLIIQAALELSNRAGFQAMSLRELSRESGVSMGGMYAYFDSKTTLLNMILSEVTAAVERILTNPPEQVQEDPIDHLKWFIEAHIRLTEAMLPWFVFSFMEAKNFPKEQRKMAINSEELTERYISEICDRAQRQGSFKKDISPILPSLIKPLLQDWYVKRSKYMRRGVSADHYIKTVQSFVLDASMERISSPTGIVRGR